MEMCYKHLTRSSYKETLDVLESDIQHANALAKSLPRATGGGERIQMKFCYDHLAPHLMLLIQRLGFSSTSLLPYFLRQFSIIIYEVNGDGRAKASSLQRKATIRDFYGVILPSLQVSMAFASIDTLFIEEEVRSVRMLGRETRRLNRLDSECEDDECGICMETCTKIVLPSCCHAMCFNCYNDWKTRSESCPFCRGSIERVNSEDLWVLISSEDVVDTKTVAEEDTMRFYNYIKNLPTDIPDPPFLAYNDYLI
ncbi:zinc finger protein [Macleaya cordata]|uniref:Zinc finger protein n=1 Tax=Macleaya cordata TaxID=56857 RepID=A0A200PXK4_MACCD|nr:zinc finger protein [Macleaya cordata]